MNKVRYAAAVLLAIPLLLFGGSYYIHPIPLPPDNGMIGIQLLHLMRAGGLTYPITFSHVLAGVFLLIPRTRFLAALLQLPITIGILAFHLTMWREGAPIACVMLILNLIALAETEKWRAVLGKTPGMS